MIEALNQRAMMNQQTPLLGGETPVYVAGGTGYEGVTPRHAVPPTPNPYAPTPRGAAGSTPLRTPLRDELSINNGFNSVMSTPREERLHQSALKRQLLAGLSSLPAPSNKFTLTMPEELEAESGDHMIEEDAAEAARKRKEILDAEGMYRMVCI